MAHAGVAAAAAAFVLLALQTTIAGAGGAGSGERSGARSGEAAVSRAVPTQQGVVTNLVDGDTLDVRLAGVVVRIRLLNVDAPETKKPDSPVECMGPEASARLAELVPVGSTVGLSFDVDRTDRFGRTLAMVTTETGVNVSEALASDGLGVAVQIGRNRAGYPLVRAAEKRARAKGVGIYSNKCQ